MIGLCFGKVTLLICLEREPRWVWLASEDTIAVVHVTDSGTLDCGDDVEVERGGPRTRNFVDKMAGFE